MTDAFSSKYLQQSSVIKSLLSLSLKKSNRFQWISEARICINEMTRLKTTAETFAQYYLWNNMDESYKKEFMIVTGKSESQLKDILENSAKKMTALQII